MATRIPVAFEGDGAGTEELSWGQLDLWLAMDRMGTWLPLGFVKPLQEGTSVDDIAADLRFIMSRYQTLRTRLRFGPGDDPPRQVVAQAGVVTLDVVDADDHADPAKVAVDLQRRYEEADYDFARDWPVRTGVIRHRGRPTHQVMVMCHLVSDAGGGRIMAGDLASRDPRTGQTAGPVAEMQPMRLAQWQRTPAARRQSQAAVRYTADVLRAVPAGGSGEPVDARQPRYWQFGFTSRAAYLALQAITTRTGIDTAPVLLAGYAIALARVSGVNPVVTRVLVGNRFRRELADVVAPLSQGGLFLVDLTGTTFDEALSRSRHRALSAYKHAYYDPRDMAGLEERISRERNQPIEVVSFFNDRRPPATAGGAGGAAVPTHEQVLAALPETTLRHERKQDEPLERLFVHVNNAPDTLDLTVLTDTHHISPLDVETLLHTMEAVLVEGAFTPDAPTRVPESPATAGSARSSGDSPIPGAVRS